MNSEEDWATIPAVTRILRAASKDEMRPALTMPFLEKDSEDKWWICATNSYIAARVPVRGNTSSLRECSLPRDFVKALYAPVRAYNKARDSIDLYDGLAFDAIVHPGDPYFGIENDRLVTAAVPGYPGETESFEIPDLDTRPRIEKLVDVGATVKQQWKPGSLSEIGLNAQMLHDVSKAIGAGGMSRLVFGDSPLAAVHVYPPRPSLGEGLIMPVRLTEAGI